MLPVPAGSDHDEEFGVFDGTTKQDGWARFSGTSAAAPQVAAVCALMLEKNPGLSPQQLKSLLKASATDVQHGEAAGVDGDRGLAAGAGRDRATGAGLVNAKAAVDMA
jgi:subtilisin family serine protease